MESKKDVPESLIKCLKEIRSKLADSTKKALEHYLDLSLKNDQFDYVKANIVNISCSRSACFFGSSVTTF